MAKIIRLQLEVYEDGDAHRDQLVIRSPEGLQYILDLTPDAGMGPPAQATTDGNAVFNIPIVQSQTIAFQWRHERVE